MRYGWLGVFGIGAAMLAADPVQAELDLKRAEISRLPNGLTIILLEDHSFPVVSVQMLYKSGSRDETAGKTGLAHFLEHLAFRASENFPDAAATEAIYDTGGEWHGYTWLDQTTYFSTMPAGGLDLLLRIEADRMAKVTIDAASIAAEKGAVITEMHGYENDPASVLLDAVTATAIQAHPYRNNTIGYEADVAALTADDARAFYAAHYAPANAVLAIVGDVLPTQAKSLVARHFGALPPRAGPVRVAAIEPLQRGERRTTLLGPVDRQFFQIAYPAPAASSPDFPGFLVLRQLLSGGSGVNFRQNDWGTPAVPGSLLHGATNDIASWFIPTADRYIFAIKGSLDPGAAQALLEQDMERRIAALPNRAPSAARLASAKAAVVGQLVEDVQTTEDAAHQLAFFEGIGAHDMLVNLPERVRQVSGAEVQRVAQAYLRPQFRTIGWYVPGNPARAQGLAAAPAAAAPRDGIPPSSGAAPAAQLHRLSGGVPALIQSNPLSPTVTVQLLTTAPTKDGEQPRDLPGLGTITRSGAAAELAKIVADAAKALASGPAKQEPPNTDPEARLEQMIQSEIGMPDVRAPAKLVAAVLSGDVEPGAAFLALEKSFGSIAPAQPRDTGIPPYRGPLRTVRTKIDRRLSQGALGYVVVAAPRPGTREGRAWRMLLYILTHDYSGRLGRSAIADKGLAYHIDSSYRTDGATGWVTLTTGVDPDKADAMEAELRGQLARLATDPPSLAEVEAARRHLLGRDLSAAQSNEEIAAKLTRQFVETGGMRSHGQLEAMLNAAAPADVAAAAAAFARGTIVRVDVSR